MSTLRTFSRGAATSAKFQPLASGNHADQLRADLATVTDDLTGGVVAGATLTGPARTFTGSTQRVIVVGWASAPGTLYVETSSDGGTTWPNVDSEAITAGETVQGVATTVGGANRYRLRFVCGPVGASRVAFSSQARA